MLLVYSSGWTQEQITELPEGEFSPDLEQVEDYELGIPVYDGYSSFVPTPMIRKDESGNPVKGKKEDYYSNGFILHKGKYADGVLTSFTNYYVNGSKERQFKGKKEGEGELACFYINGHYRSVSTFYNFNEVGSETYYNNGVLKKKVVLEEETLVPTLIVTKNNENTVMTKVELIDEDSLIYEKEVYRVNGDRMAYGRMVMNETTGDIVNDGPYYTFDQKGNFTSEVIYANGNVTEVKLEERPEAEQEYFSYETPVEVAENTEHTENDSDEEFVEKSSAIIPTDYVRFDLDQDDFISNKEVDFAVSEFFEDDSITLSQINGLVNYFFEQD